MTIDLKDTAKSLIAALIHSDRLDTSQLLDDIYEELDTAADNACIYYHWCEEIISRYESDPSRRGCMALLHLGKLI